MLGVDNRYKCLFMTALTLNQTICFDATNRKTPRVVNISRKEPKLQKVVKAVKITSQLYNYKRVGHLTLI